MPQDKVLAAFLQRFWINAAIIEGFFAQKKNQFISSIFRGISLHKSF